MSELKELYNNKYRDEPTTKLTLRPEGLHTNTYDDIRRLLNRVSKGGNMLEIGCGSGELTFALADRFDQVIGVDLAAVRICNARKTVMERETGLADKVNFLEVDCEKGLPFENDKFDVVILCAVLEHVVDVFNLMDEVSRVCKKSGFVIVAVPNIAYIKHVIGLLFGKLPLTGIGVEDMKLWREEGWDGAHFHYFTKSSLNRLLQNVGFTALEWTGDGKFAKYRRWYQNFVGGLTVLATNDARK